MLIRAALALFLCVVGMSATAQSSVRDIVLHIAPDAEASRISVVVTPNLSHTRRLPTAELRQARKDMLADKDISDDLLRGIAVHFDGLAAQKLVERMVADGAEKHTSDIAFFGSIAVSTGRIKSLRPAIAAMMQLDAAMEPAERVRVYAAMLYGHAWAGNPLALDAVIDLNGEGKLFGPLSQKTRAKIIAQGDAAGDGRVALRFAVALMDRTDAPMADLEQARAFLVQAEGGPHFAVKTTAANLLTILDARMASQ
jgi:hypothetical protein